MNIALIEAKNALLKNEVPIGAIIVCQNKIIAKAHNLTETLNDATAHAEMQVITAAASYLGTKYLKECTLYVTLEPCNMCAGALYWSKIDTVVFGAKDKKNNTLSLYHPKTKIIANIKEKECLNLIKEFFKNKR